MTTGDELSAAVQARQEADRLAQRLGEATARAEKSRAEADAAGARLTGEERDVARLESLSWPRILAALKGSRASDLEREQAERDRARYEAAVARAHATADADEAASLKARLAALGDVEGRYAAALDARERWIRDHGEVVAVRLEDIARQRGRVSEEIREVEEAIAAGEAALQCLSHAAELLGSARSWSTYDTFFGGGFFADAMKYDRLDQVSASLRQAADAVRRFSRELVDVGVAALQTTEVGALGQAFDVFFDNLFSDFAVRERIIAAGEHTRVDLDRVQRVMASLEARRTELRRREQQIAGERAALLGG